MSSYFKTNEYDFDSDMSEIGDSDQVTAWLDEEGINFLSYISVLFY